MIQKRGPMDRELFVFIDCMTRANDSCELQQYCDEQLDRAKRAFDQLCTLIRACGEQRRDLDRQALEEDKAHRVKDLPLTE
jgi:hypothetical protein